MNLSGPPPLAPDAVPVVLRPFLGRAAALDAWRSVWDAGRAVGFAEGIAEAAALALALLLVAVGSGIVAAALLRRARP